MLSAPLFLISRAGSGWNVISVRPPRPPTRRKHTAHCTAHSRNRLWYGCPIPPGLCSRLRLRAFEGARHPRTIRSNGRRHRSIPRAASTRRGASHSTASLDMLLRQRRLPLLETQPGRAGWVGEGRFHRRPAGSGTFNSSIIFIHTPIHLVPSRSNFLALAWPLRLSQAWLTGPVESCRILHSAIIDSFVSHLHTHAFCFFFVPTWRRNHHHPRWQTWIR